MAGAKETIGYLRLSDYVLILLRKKWVIIVGTTIAIIASVIISLILPQKYAIEAQIDISPIKQKAFGQQFQQIYPLAKFDTLLKNPFLISRIISQFELDEPPFSYTVASFLADLEFEPITGTSIISTSFYFSKRELGTQIMDALISETIKMNEDNIQEQIKSTEEVIRPELDGALQKMEDAYVEFIENRTKLQLDWVRQRISANLQQYNKYLAGSSDSPGLLFIDTEISRLVKYTSNLRADLGKQQKLLNLNRSVVDSPEMTEYLRERRAAANPGSSSSDYRLRLEDQVVNPVFEELEAKMLDVEATIESFKNLRKEIPGKIKVLIENYKSDLEELTIAESIISKLESKVNTYKDTVKKIRLQMAESKLGVLEYNFTIRPVARSMASERPVHPNKVAVVSITTMSGFLLMIVAVLIVEGVRRRRADNSRS